MRASNRGHPWEKGLINLTCYFTLAAHIPALTEMCSKALVLSAQLNFDVTNPRKIPKRNQPKFSIEHREAYANHEKVCTEWWLAGKPKEISHPANLNKLESQRNLYRIARESESSSAIKNHNEFIE